MFSFLARHRNQIVKYFKVFYYLITLFILYGSYEIYFNKIHLIFWYQLGIAAAKTAIILFIIVLLPGITRRFGIRHPVFNLIMLFRRYLGITTYLFMSTHFLFVGLSNLLAYNLLKIPLFMFFGLSAFLLLLPLFLTSNDLSVRNLGPWWTRIHNLIYIAAWFIFGHVILQSWTIWSILIGTAAILETTSLIYHYLKTKNPQPIIHNS